MSSESQNKILKQKKTLSKKKNTKITYLVKNVLKNTKKIEIIATRDAYLIHLL